MNVGIVSLGLIGGSILKALYGKGHCLYAVTRNKSTIIIAKNYTQNVSDNFEILKNCDIVFVASPIEKTNEILDKLENYLSENCIVLDCASVKSCFMKKRKYKFIPSHPMAGTENNGFEHSFKELFQGAIWVLTPFDDTLSKDIKIVEDIIKLLNAKIIITTAQEHDEAVALISHIPLLVAQSLCLYIKDNELAKHLASSGFRDTTRLALSNIDMAVDMMKFNSENIKNGINSLFESINFINNAKDLKILSEIKSIRNNMYSKEGKNIYNKQ